MRVGALVCWCIDVHTREVAHSRHSEYNAQTTTPPHHHHTPSRHIPRNLATSAPRGWVQWKILPHPRQLTMRLSSCEANPAGPCAPGLFFLSWGVFDLVLEGALRIVTEVPARSGAAWWCWWFVYGGWVGKSVCNLVVLVVCVGMWCMCVVQCVWCDVCRSGAQKWV